jgi:hypothetical protein
MSITPQQGLNVKLTTLVDLVINHPSYVGIVADLRASDSVRHRCTACGA